MHKAWIDFAVTGDPGWPAYDHTTRSTMVFNTTRVCSPIRVRMTGGTGNADRCRVGAAALRRAAPTEPGVAG